jgi:GT2 family glycosyltransferase
MQISAYIPCYNGAATLAHAIESLNAQTLPPDELFMVDNHSIDSSRRIAERLGVRVIALAGDMGRGAARARAMAEARFPLVACCDASVVLPSDFLSRAVRWFDEPQVAAVCGRIAQEEARCVADRWRGRHLFRTEKRTAFLENAPFTTGAAMARAEAVRQAGGYDPAQYHGEDADLGRRLLRAGCKVIFDPALVYWQSDSNSVPRVLERYWRWARANGRMTFRTYLSQIKYSVTEMAREDLRSGDVSAALISLASPHYQFWRDRVG